MRFLISVLFLATALCAQTRTALESKYGPLEGDRFRAKPGIAVEVTFSESGKAKAFRIVPDDPNNKNALLGIDDVRNLIRELIPGRICHIPSKTTEMKLSCPPWRECRGIQEEWKRVTTLMVLHKDAVAYNLITLNDEPVPPPGQMKLLPGYEHVPSCGIDTAGGYIRKEGGLEIHYDVGEMAGNFAVRYANPDFSEWIRTEPVQNDCVLIVLTKQNRIIATYEKAVANFSAKVSSQSDIDDFLKMVLTYVPPAR